MAAGFNEALEIIDTLIHAGADVNGEPNTITPLIQASRFHPQGIEAAKILLDAGANVNARDKQGWTALMWAAYFGKKGKKDEILEMLVNAGAQITEEEIELVIQDNAEFKDTDTYTKVKNYASGKCAGS
jgi:ankyrin repeat protein